MVVVRWRVEGRRHGVIVFVVEERLGLDLSHWRTPARRDVKVVSECLVVSLEVRLHCFYGRKSPGRNLVVDGSLRLRVVT